MKKMIVLAALTTLSASTFANEKLSTSELKSMDCPTLAVEKADAKRSLETVEKNLANAQAQSGSKTVSKWAGLAGGALSAFSGNSEKVARTSEVLGNMSQTDTSDASNVELQQQIKANAQANIENIGIYQGSKKCKI